MLIANPSPTIITPEVEVEATGSGTGFTLIVPLLIDKPAPICTIPWLVVVAVCGVCTNATSTPLVLTDNPLPTITPPSVLVVAGGIIVLNRALLT